MNDTGPDVGEHEGSIPSFRWARLAPVLVHRLRARIDRSGKLHTEQETGSDRSVVLARRYEANRRKAGTRGIQPARGNSGLSGTHLDHRAVFVDPQPQQQARGRVRARAGDGKSDADRRRGPRVGIDLSGRIPRRIGSRRHARAARLDSVSRGSGRDRVPCITPLRFTPSRWSRLGASVRYFNTGLRRSNLDVRLGLRFFLDLKPGAQGRMRRHLRQAWRRRSRDRGEQPSMAGRRNPQGDRQALPFQAAAGTSLRCGRVRCNC